MNSIYSSYTIQNALVIFGAFQGIILCFFLYQRKKENPLAYLFFTLFLFSLSYVNLWYGLYFMEIYSIGNIPLGSFPYPYEFLMGVGFYFYIRSQILLPEKSNFIKKHCYVFIPAVLYGIFLLTCYVILIKEGNSDIIRDIEATGFYTTIEFIRFTFNLLLGYTAITFLNRVVNNNTVSSKVVKSINWLLLFSKVFIGYNIVSILLTSITFLLGSVNISSFYLTFFTNTLFIYWVGYVGYTKSNLLFSKHSIEATTDLDEQQQLLEQRLSYYMIEQEKFKEHDISLSKLALLMQVSGKKLSAHINHVHQMNFSEYIHTHRVKNAKALLISSTYDHYTIEAIAKEAGFSSKTTFNTTFKKITGYTPSQYKKISKSE